MICSTCNKDENCGYTQLDNVPAESSRKISMVLCDECFLDFGYKKEDNQPATNDWMNNQ